jgi:hypothetical protein
LQNCSRCGRRSGRSGLRSKGARLAPEKPATGAWPRPRPRRPGQGSRHSSPMPTGGGTRSGRLPAPPAQCRPPPRRRWRSDATGVPPGQPFHDRGHGFPPVGNGRLHGGTSSCGADRSHACSVLEDRVARHHPAANHPGWPADGGYLRVGVRSLYSRNSATPKASTDRQERQDHAALPAAGRAVDAVDDPKFSWMEWWSHRKDFQAQSGGRLGGGVVVGVADDDLAAVGGGWIFQPKVPGLRSQGRPPAAKTSSS